MIQELPVERLSPAGYAEASAGKIALMRRLTVLLLLATPLLNGCVAGIAASAVGSTIRATSGEPKSNAHLAEQAVRACSARAAQHGTVHIIDVEQRSVDKLVVWGTAGEGAERRSFECAYGMAIDAFKLREIRKKVSSTRNEADELPCNAAPNARETLRGNRPLSAVTFQA